MLVERPRFPLKQLEDHPCPDGSEAIYLSPGDPEVMKIIAMATQTLGHFSLPKRIDYFSCWHRAKRAVANLFAITEEIPNKNEELEFSQI